MTKKQAYFISPHLDDAAFSAGALMSHLVKSSQVTVATVFTQGGKSNTLSARQFLKQNNSADSRSLYRLRRLEDTNALSRAGIKAIHLGYTDALWRTIASRRSLLIPELKAVYPTYRLHITRGLVSVHDAELIKQIATRLKKLVKGKKALIFCPVGHGHIDHLVTRLACERAFGSARLTYWLDFPYSERSAFDSTAYTEVLPARPSKGDYVSKLKLAKLYTSQYGLVFSHDNELSKAKEIFYTSKIQYSEEDSITDQMRRYMARVIQSNILTKHIIAFISSPKDYLFVILTSYRSTPVSPRKRVDNVARQLCTHLRQLLPGIEPILIGSVGLGSIYGDDIDIVIPAYQEDIEETVEILRKAFGKPFNNKHNIVQWQVLYNNVKADIDLLPHTSSRLRRQLYTVQLFKQYPSLFDLYQKLKVRWDLLPPMLDNLEGIIFFRRIYKLHNQDRNQMIFPSYIGQYRFDHEITIQNQSAFKYAIYLDQKGNKYFSKFLSKHSSIVDLRSLTNERRVYQYLTRIVNRGDNNIEIPHLVASGETLSSRYIIVEYIEGKLLSKVGILNRAQLLAQVSQLLSGIKEKYPSKISRRGPSYWLFITPFLYIGAIWRNPQQLLLYTKTLALILSRAGYILTRRYRSLVHRDLSFYNIITTESARYLFDFQLACWGDPILEQAVIYTKHSQNQRFLSAWQKQPGIVPIRQPSDVAEAMRIYIAILCLYNQAIKNGSHVTSAHLLKRILAQYN